MHLPTIRDQSGLFCESGGGPALPADPVSGALLGEVRTLKAHSLDMCSAPLFSDNPRFMQELRNRCS